MSNGLTPKEEKVLHTRLKQLNEILTRCCLMGAGEAHLMVMLATRMRVRLYPETVIALDEEAQAMIDRNASLDWVQAALKRAAA